MLEPQDINQFKKILEENNKNLVTKQDLIENNKNLVTKQYLEEALEKNNKNLVTKDGLKIALEENNKNLVTKDGLKTALEDNNKNLLRSEGLKQVFEENNRVLIQQVAIEVGKVIEQNVTPAFDSHFQEVDLKLGRFNHDLKEYIDKKNGELKGDIVSVIKGDRERDRTLKGKTAMFTRHR